MAFSKNKYANSFIITKCTFRLQDASIFVFEKRLSDRLHRPRRKDSITEIMKKSVKHLEVYRQPKLILTVLHSLEEGSDTIAFASEPVLASLANVLNYQAYMNPIESSENEDNTMSNNLPARPPAHLLSNATEYNFIDYEVKYGLRQVSDIQLNIFILCNTSKYFIQIILLCI